jgi:hypothetical protein
MKVTFLKSGEVTWASRGGRHEKRDYISAGTTLRLRVERHGDKWELWDGDWSILVPADVVQVEKEQR